MNLLQVFRKVFSQKYNAIILYIEVPRNTSKILANVKREDNRAEVRAKTFL